MPPSERPRVEELREAVRRAVELGSLRSVAKDVGMTAMGLRHFIVEGGTPHFATQQKLEAWYANVGERTVRSAFALAVARFPRRERAQAIDHLLEALREMHRAKGVEMPPWLAGTAEGEEKDEK